MRKLSASLVVAMALVGLLGFSSEASAQNEPLILNNVQAWWDHLNCPKMINAVNAIPDAVATGTPPHPVLSGDEDAAVAPFGDSDSEREWCQKWDGLGENQRRALTAGATNATSGITTTATNRVFDVRVGGMSA